MSLTALGLVLACSFAWSGLDLARKLLADRMRPVPLLFLLTVGPLPIFLAWVGLEGAVAIAPGYWLPGLVSVAVNVLANALFLASVRASPLSLTIPLLSLTPVFASLVAVPLLGEYPTPRQGLGIAVAVAGALLLNLGQGDRTSLAGMWGAFRRERGSVLMAAVALLWSLTPPLDKLAIEHSGVPVHGLVLNLGVALAMLAQLVGQRRLGELRAVRGALLPYAAAVLASAAALGLQLLAIRVVLVGIVETIKRGVGCLMAVLLGRTVLGEPLTPFKLAAIALMAAGVALILV
jgi:drug/metabolite transporter (DMT)-like permease